jgi:hypothetical protein
MAQRSEVPLTDPEAKLELALIQSYLHDRGHSLAELQTLPEAQKLALWRDAELYAAGRLAEIGARAHYVADLHKHE